jgi:hypothetical protein
VARTRPYKSWKRLGQLVEKKINGSYAAFPSNDEVCSSVSWSLAWIGSPSPRPLIVVPGNSGRPLNSCRPRLCFRPKPRQQWR